MRTRVKVCGTTNPGDALHAAEYGVDALGFIFARKSPRYISAADAADIIRKIPVFIDRVGVFVNSSVEDVVDITKCGLSVVQLHGNETPEYCAELKARIPHCHILKAFRVSEQTGPDEFKVYSGRVDGFLLDTYVKGNEGGTGAVFDWSIIKGLHLKLPFLLAGGLSPDNIEQAIDEVAPYGVDVNSGIEIAPGKKDHNALRLLMERVAAADLRAKRS